MGTDQSKLRRFGLIVGVSLFLYTIAEIQFETPVRIESFGVPLLINRPYVLEWGLVGMSLYASWRYWYNAFLISISPFQARKLLLNRVYEEVNSMLQARELVLKFFPSLPRGRWEVKPLSEGGLSVGVEKSTFTWRNCHKTKILILLGDIDYTAPIWVNGLAIGLYFYI